MNRRTTALIESLESRQHLSTTIGIDFAPDGAPIAEGTVADTGKIFGLRSNGNSYGWDQDVSSQAVVRNTTYTPYQRSKTFIPMFNRTWEIGVEPGVYSVRVGAGDPQTSGYSIRIQAEGKTVVSGTTSSSKRLLTGSTTVTVTDGKLTLQSYDPTQVNPIGYVEIKYVGPASTLTPTPPPTPVPAGTLKWTPAARMPVPRVEPESMVVDGKLYVFSGYADSNWQPIRRVDVYDPVTNTWRRLSDMPIGTTHAAVARIGSRIWFVGGYTARPGTTNRQDFGTRSVLIYDTQTDTWSTGPSLPARRASGGLALVDNRLYFFAGEDEKRINRTQHWMLDLNNLSAGWVTRASIPEGRTHFGTAVVNGQVYVIGGQIGIDSGSVHLKTSWKYDPATNTWTRLADLPQERSHLSPCTVAVGTKIYTFGGEYKYNVDVSTVTEYDTLNNTYRNLTSLPGARASGAAGYINGRFVFTGGKKNGFYADTWIGTFV